MSDNCSTCLLHLPYPNSMLADNPDSVSRKRRACQLCRHPEGRVVLKSNVDDGCAQLPYIHRLEILLRRYTGIIQGLGLRSSQMSQLERVPTCQHLRSTVHHEALVLGHSVELRIEGFCYAVSPILRQVCCFAHFELCPHLQPARRQRYVMTPRLRRAKTLARGTEQVNL